MAIDQRFPSRVNLIGELPDSLRTALEAVTQPGEAHRLLIHSPAVTLPSHVVREAVLAVSDSKWHLVSDNGDDTVSVESSDFADTMLMELTDILLYGRLKIDFVTEAAWRSTFVEFNAVNSVLYRHVIDMILTGIEATPRLSNASDASFVTSDWSIKFHNLAQDFAQGKNVLGAVSWPTVHGGFNRELAPAAALLLASNQIILIAEPKAQWWDRFSHDQRLGVVVTYLPLARLCEFEITHHACIAVLSLSMRTSCCGEKLEVIFPSASLNDVTALMEEAMKPNRS